jgi:L-fucose isomerase
MLFGKLLTNAAQVFCDVRTYWSPDAIKRVNGGVLPDSAKNGFIHLINSGAAALDGSGKAKIDGKPAIKPFYELTEAEAQACLDATEWCPGNVEYFRGGGFSSRFETEGGMPATMVRLNLVKGLGPVIQIAEGHTIGLPGGLADKIWARTDYTWPTTWFVPATDGRGAFADVYSVMANWGANHCALSYGHIGADLITLASILRIPVSMHNVSEEKIFRPHVFTAFGQDKEAADYKACRALGPLYR